MLAADSIPLTPELFCTVVSLLACGSVIGTVGLACISLQSCNMLQFTIYIPVVLLNLLSREQRVDGTSFVITFTIIIACVKVKVIFTCIHVQCNNTQFIVANV